MDISRAYLQDAQLREVQNLIITTKPEHQYDRVHLRQRAFIDLDNYIAQLINEKRIDERYVSNRIKCDIAWLETMVHGDRPDLVEGTAQISRYSKTGRHKGCQDGYKP